MLNNKDFANTSNYVPEDTYFEDKRRLQGKGYEVEEVDHKWSDGESPIILIKYKYWSKQKN